MLRSDMRSGGPSDGPSDGPEENLVLQGVGVVSGPAAGPQGPDARTLSRRTTTVMRAEPIALARLAHANGKTRRCGSSQRTAPGCSSVAKSTTRGSVVAGLSASTT